MAWIALAGAWADNISAGDITLPAGGTRTVNISLTNTESNLVSFQMDLTLPEGISINKAGCSLSNRISDPDQELTIGKRGDNVYRLASTSFALTPISGTSGTLLTLSLTASANTEGGTATLSNIRFVTSNSERVTISDASFNINMAISFADANVKALCVQNWDTDGDGELSEDEAAAVTDLGVVFKENTTITSFNELQYFTGLTSIKDGAFYGCSNLNSVIIPESVTSILDNAFRACSGLISVNIPEGVTSIGQWAFLGCNKLTSVTIPISVTRIGKSAFYECSSLTSMTIPASVTSIGEASFSHCSSLTAITVENGNSYYVSENGVLFNKNKTSLLCFPAGKTQSTYAIPESVTRIFPYAFDNCKSLTSVTIPNSVTSIGDHAFYWCTGLTSVTIPSGVTVISDNMFQDCRNLTSVTIPNSVSSIGGHAFYRCLKLTSVTIPSSVTSIGNYAFQSCDNLTSVTVEMETPLTITELTFTNRANATLYVPAGCKAAYEAAQYWQDFNIVSVITFADANVKALCVQNWDTDGDGELSEDEAAAVTDLGEVFKGNTTITSFNELQYFTGLTSIGDEAFRGCSALTTVTIPNSVTSIGQHAFHSCIGLTTVTIPESVTGIGFAAFHQCNSLTSVTIPASVTNISGTVFGSCSSLTSIIVENGNNTYISEDGVLYNKDKTTIICYPAGKVQTEFFIPESVTSIIYGAFSGCSRLTVVTIPNSVTIIGKTAFGGCTGLTSVTIPSSVTSIGDGAFNGCSNLTSVTVEMETPLTITENTFTNRANATLYVPAGSKAAYEAAQYWQDFNIVELSPVITFADANVKAICVQNWDTDGDGELSEAEAAAVTDLGTVFKENTTITSFDELQYFTGLTSIADSAFISCRGLTSITIPNSVTSIEIRAFKSCTGMTTVTFPSSMTKIGYAAFQKCTGLISVTIPTSVAIIGSAAFATCTSLTSITVENGNNVYISDDGVLFNKNKTSILCYPAGKTQSTYSIPSSVTDIRPNAFDSCRSLTSVTIPSSVTSIGNDAFYNCTGLTSVTIPEGVTSISNNAFSFCSGLTSVTIPSSVTTIGSGAFRGCSNLTSVTVELETPLTITENTFTNRTNATLYVPAGCKDAYEAVQYWQDFNIVSVISFADANVKALCVQNWDTNGDGELSEAEAAAVTDLGEVFKGNKNITSFDELQYFTGLTNIGDNAFNYCSAMTSVTFPNSLTSIGKWSFQYCSGLTSIIIPNSVKSIGVAAFHRCNSLTSVTIPESVTSIDYAAFSDCTGLTSIIVDDGNSSYISEDGVLFDKDKKSLLCFPAGKTQSTYTIPESVTKVYAHAFERCSSLTSVTIPDNVTSIGKFAFRASGLTSVTIPNSVTTIGERVFLDCSSLTSVTIPNSVTTIGLNAFGNCTSLTSVSIPSSVTSIGESAFNGCTNLTSVTVEMETPLTIAENTFSNRANATLYVPAGCKAAYQAAEYWQDFNIVELSPVITFADANVKAICVQNWDTDGDSELSEAEAAAVTDLGEVFKGNTTITSFDELQYFTGLTSIADSAFYYCSALTSVTIPNSVTTIGQQAFRYCYGLTTVSIPESVTIIDDMAFFACTRMASVTIPESVTSIGQSAFYSCSALTSVVIPNSVTTIKEVAFSNCSSLTSIIVDNNTSYIVEDGVLFNKNKTSLLCYPAGKTQSTYTIPSSVTRICSYAFDGCSALTSVTIPNSVTIFGQAAFRKCSDLTSVTIPESVTSIGKFAFQDCSSLTSVTVEMETPLTIESATFTNRANATLYVPAGCKAAYEAAQYWQDFNIEEMASSLEPTDISQLDDAIYAQGRGTVGNHGTLVVSLKNAQAAAAYEFTLQLPDGITLATDDSGEYIYTLSGRHNGHTLSLNDNGNGMYGLLVHSPASKPIGDNDGSVLSVTINIADNISIADYGVTIKNAKYSFPDGSASVKMPETIGIISVNDKLLGDVNSDGEVDVADVVCYVNHLIGKPTLVFVEESADVNFDGEYDVADVVRIVNRLIGKIPMFSTAPNEADSTEKTVTLPEPE